MSSGSSPWLTFGGIPAPFAGLFSATGATAALIDPNSASLGQSSGLLSAFHLTPSVPVTNLAQFGYALNVGTSPMSLLAAQAHLGRGISPAGPLHGWDGAGALTPITRFATMFSGLGVAGRRRHRVVLPGAPHDRLGCGWERHSPTRRSGCSAWTRRWGASCRGVC